MTEKDRAMAKRTEHLFRALIDGAALSFPKLDLEPSAVQNLSARMREMLKEEVARGKADAADLLRARRKLLEMDVAALAGKAELSLSTVRALESGRMIPTDIQPEVFARVLLLLGVGFDAYLDVHGRSIQPKKRGRSYRSAALKRHGEQRGPRTGSAAAGPGWLNRLAEAMRRPITT